MADFYDDDNRIGGGYGTYDRFSDVYQTRRRPGDIDDEDDDDIVPRTRRSRTRTTSSRSASRSQGSRTAAASRNSGTSRTSGNYGRSTSRTGSTRSASRSASSRSTTGTRSERQSASRSANRTRRSTTSRSGVVDRNGETNAQVREKQRVKKQLWVSAGIVLAMFGAMIIYIVIYAASNERTLFENDYNGREGLLLAQNTRGRILADDGQTVIADTEPDAVKTTTTDEDGNEVETTSDLRTYPFGSLFSHIVGYTEKGGAGIELLENYNLVHTNLSLAEKASYDEAGKKYPGNDVYTTLQTKLQQAASDALGNNKGTVIVTDVKTGAILCLVSKPDYDATTLLQDWDTLSTDSANGTLVNSATQGLYAPGSTFKIFDAIEFMSEDMARANAYNFNCEGYVRIDGETINCFHWEVHGDVDLAHSFAESCNSSFATIGTTVNREQFNASLQNMLFGDTTGLYDEVPDGVSPSSYVLDAATPTKEVMQLSIGQGQTLMTPLHLNLITAAIGNGGTIYKPYVVQSVKTYTGDVIEETKPTAYKNIMSNDVAAKMREMMRLTVTDGTASKLSTRTYNPGGKTGSAEYISGSSQSHAWFTGIAPVENPEIAITVIVEGAGVGGTSAVPAARSVMDQYFGYTPAQGEDESIMDHVANDHNHNGIPDQNESGYSSSSSASSSVTMNMDTNGDGIMDAIDIDGDGKPDAFDTNGDGVIDTNIGATSQNVTVKTEAEQAAEANNETANTAEQTTNENTATEQTQSNTAVEEPVTEEPTEQAGVFIPEDELEGNT